MMCEVMPTINEGDPNGLQPDSQNGSESDSNFEQLMVNMLDERDKLLEALRENQETLFLTQSKLQEINHEKEQLHRQLSAALPQARVCLPQFIWQNGGQYDIPTGISSPPSQDALWHVS